MNLSKFMELGSRPHIPKRREPHLIRELLAMGDDETAASIGRNLRPRARASLGLSPRTESPLRRYNE
jgi:hypothetical protein